MNELVKPIQSCVMGDVGRPQGVAEEGETHLLDQHVQILGELRSEAYIYEESHRQP